MTRKGTGLAPAGAAGGGAGGGTRGRDVGTLEQGGFLA